MRHPWNEAPPLDTTHAETKRQKGLDLRGLGLEQCLGLMGGLVGAGQA